MSVFAKRWPIAGPGHNPPEAAPTSPADGPRSIPTVLCHSRAWLGLVRIVAWPSRTSRIDIPRNKITALIGPSGCGKSTLLRCFNRMNDLITGARDAKARSASTAS